MSKRKQYKPRGINPNAIHDTIRLAMPVSIDSREKLELDARLAIEAFTDGVAKKAHFDILASTVDISMMLSNTLFEGAYSEEIENARQGMIRCKNRFIRTSALGLDGEGYNDIKYVIEIYAEKLKQVTGAEIMKIMKAREQNIRSGNYYHGERKAA